MYYHIPKNGLALSEILSATKRQIEPGSGFPYTKEVCRRDDVDTACTAKMVNVLCSPVAVCPNASVPMPVPSRKS
jgi:hypothetical protein